MTEIVAKTTQVAEHVALAAAGDPLAYVSLFSDGVEAAKIVGECLKVKETDLDKKSKLTFVLSPSFGTLTKDDVRKMDEFLMASCAFAKKQLAKNLETKGLALTWSDVLGTMNQCQALKTRGAPAAKADTLQQTSVDWFKLGGTTADKEKVQEVQDFLTNLIGDEDISLSVGFKDSDLDFPGRGLGDAVEIIKSVITSTDAAILKLPEVLFKHEKQHKTLLDVGILRYPDKTKPYLSVYRVKLEAVRDCQKIGPVEKNTSNLLAEVNSQEYEPNLEVLKALNPEVIEKSVAFFESSF